MDLSKQSFWPPPNQFEPDPPKPASLLSGGAISLPLVRRGNAVGRAGVLLLLIGLIFDRHVALAQNATHTVRLMVPDTALKAANAALQSCRNQGYQVAVAVTDRFGVTQVMLCDRFAGPHTVDTAMNKAWTAITYRQDTLAFDIATSKEPRAAGARMLPRIVPIGGGVLIEASGALLGAVAVSGAPGGAADDHCARAGLAAVRDELEF